jgi:pSer/pThr/pTyr-binding forkhead associated (FHA) protein
VLEQLFTFVSMAHKKPRDQFVASFPEPVLVIEPFAEAGGGKFGTIAGGAGSGQETSVARIKKREGANAFGIMVTIGRARNNDIELRSQDVSKFHAYVMFGANGEVSITDAGSTYGTFVKGRQLKAREDKVALAPGDEVKIGSVLCHFHTPASFFDYLRRPSP